MINAEVQPGIAKQETTIQLWTEIRVKSFRPSPLYSECEGRSRLYERGLLLFTRFATNEAIDS